MFRVTMVLRLSTTPSTVAKTTTNRHTIQAYKTQIQQSKKSSTPSWMIWKILCHLRKILQEILARRLQSALAAKSSKMQIACQITSSLSWNWNTMALLQNKEQSIPRPHVVMFVFIIILCIIVCRFMFIPIAAITGNYLCNDKLQFFF